MKHLKMMVCVLLFVPLLAEAREFYSAKLTFKLVHTSADRGSTKLGKVKAKLLVSDDSAVCEVHFKDGMVAKCRDSEDEYSYPAFPQHHWWHVDGCWQTGSFHLDASTMSHVLAAATPKKYLKVLERFESAFAQERSGNAYRSDSNDFYDTDYGFFQDWSCWRIKNVTKDFNNPNDPRESIRLSLSVGRLEKNSRRGD